MRSMCWKVLRKDAEMDAPTMMISLKISRENPWFGGVADAKTTGEYWMACNWAAWTLLWSCFFVMGVLKRPRWTKPVAWLTLVQSIATAWVPGYLMLSGRLS